MKEFLKTKKGCLIGYASVNILLILASLFFLFVNIEEVSVVLSISAFFDFFTLLIMLFTEIKENGEIKGGKYALMSVLRFVCTSLGIILSVVFLYLTNTDADGKYRFLYSLIALVPLFISLVFYYLKGTFEYA